MVIVKLLLVSIFVLGSEHKIMDFIKKEKILNLISEKLIILRVLVKSIPSPDSTCMSEP